MLGIGFFEIVIIALVCFIAIGPKQLPVVMRKLAGYYRQFLTLKDELRFQILSADREDKQPEHPVSLKNDQETVAREKGHGRS